MPATKTEVRKANREQLVLWMNQTYEDPGDGWDSMTVEDMKEVLLEDTDFIVEANAPADDSDSDTPGDDNEPTEVEGGQDEAHDLSRPSAATDLYSGVIRGPR